MIDYTTVLVPDIVVVRDESLLADGRSINGAPDPVIEVLFPLYGTV